MNQIQNQVFSDAKLSLKNSIGSLFTKDDIINFLECMERQIEILEDTTNQEPKQEPTEEPTQEPSDEETFDISPFLLPDFVHHIQSALATAVYELSEKLVIEDENFEYHFSGKEIYITNMNIDRDYIETKIWDSLYKALSTYENENVIY
jgi:hypothetical protein